VGYVGLIASGTRYRTSQVLISSLCVGMAFLLLAMLLCAQQAFVAGKSVASSHRLRSQGSSSITTPIPLSYANKVAQVPGIRSVLYVGAEPAAYQDDPRHLLLQAVSAATFFETFPELVVAPKQRDAFLTDKRSLLVGRETLKHYGWTLGQTVTLQTNVLDASGAASWAFHVDAVYDSDDPKIPADLTFVHYGYFNDARANGKDTVIGLVTTIDHPDQATAIAAAIDRLFATSSPRLITQPENQAVENQLTQFGDFAQIASLIAALVFLSMLLLAHNVWYERVKMRRMELATMKALGFQPHSIALLVMAEAALLTFASAAWGSVLALGIAGYLKSRIDHILPGFHFPLSGWGVIVIVTLMFSVLSSCLPAWQAARIPLAAASRD